MYLRFHQHSIFYLVQDNNSLLSHRLFLHCGRKEFLLVNIPRHIHEYRSCHNTGRGIVQHKTCLCCLRMIMFHLCILDNRSHKLLMCFRPTKYQDKLAHIFGLSYLYKFLRLSLDKLERIYASSYQRTHLQGSSKCKFLNHFEHMILQCKNERTFLNVGHQRNQVQQDI
jgi:hypothetical protein